MGRDVGAALSRSLASTAAHAGCAIDVTASDWRGWASATFSGARHRLSLAGSPTVAFETWLARLGETDVAMPGHLVADLTVAAVRRAPARVEVDLEILTVEAD